MEWMYFLDNRLKIHGLPWFQEDKPTVCRLPKRLKDTFREAVWNLALQPAGGRIRFSTNSLHVGIRAEVPDFFVMNHITRIGQSGFDVYVDGSFMGSVSPDEKGKIEKDWHIQTSPKFREITIHMPLYKSVQIDQIGIDEGSEIRDPKPFALDKPVVYYGTSITQGGCASTPGTTYQDFVSRWLNADFVNLGFSGNGWGDVEVARAINEVKASCIVLDHWANTGEKFGGTLPVFVGELRKVHKDTPIIVVGPFYFLTDDLGNPLHPKQRKDAEDFVRKMRDGGDKNIHFFDGRKMISRETSFGLVDGVHPNSLGFYFIAKGFTPFLKRVLGL